MPKPVQQTIAPSRPKTSTPVSTGAGSDLLSRIEPLNVDPDEGIKIMLYGESGSGKTTLWSTFPKPILVMLCSGGMRPGELRSIDTPEMRKVVKQIVLRDTDEVGALAAHVGATGAFNTLVLDHVSGLQDLALQEILGKKIPAQKTYGIATQQQWGQCAAFCKEGIRAMLNLSCNVVIVGQERLNKGKDDGIESEIIKPTVGVGVIPALALWLNPACDYILQMFKRGRTKETIRTVGQKGSANYKETKILESLPGISYCARTEPHHVYSTKFRVPRGSPLPEYIEDPSYDKIMALLRGAKK